MVRAVPSELLRSWLFPVAMFSHKVPRRLSPESQTAVSLSQSQSRNIAAEKTIISMCPFSGTVHCYVHAVIAAMARLASVGSGT